MRGTGIEAAQILVALLLLAVLALGGMAVVAGRQRARDGEPDRAPRVAGPVPPEPVDELAADADEVRAAAQRAMAAADAARERATAVAGMRDQAEQRYQQAKWDAWTGPADESRRLVERAALEAYRRGALSVEQLNRIWTHTRPDEAALEQVDEEVARARQRYADALVDAVEVRRAAHVAEVAAEVLAEEARLAEEQALAARIEAEATAGLSGLLDGAGEAPEPGKPA
ncbi:hypothetical protein [Actinoplanes teichomyceticus]|uniref:Uncharacterized protein n=1 Tax=Actinoplanes teichomyceticus TaxID=1867 RepID=A0A561VKK7_ACTTI|nr:hypothetical protein [Actinoplanes teichomyceticus]TWG12159.1 hypothetical protein FHX34_10526 [Actinoplanes teichomyceticus]GIF14089.1 hypothetical protein Ate01nite_41210 [Actinoplanes teichomyceticus]